MHAAARLLLLVLALPGCERTGGAAAEAGLRVPGGDAVAGRALIRAYGCTGCHIIPGIRGADVRTAPPLDRFAQRAYIAGAVPNTTENLVAWIVNPHAIQPGTAMPVLGVTAEQARHIAAHLYSLD